MGPLITNSVAVELSCKDTTCCVPASIPGISASAVDSAVVSFVGDDIAVLAGGTGVGVACVLHAARIKAAAMKQAAVWVMVCCAFQILSPISKTALRPGEKPLNVLAEAHQDQD